MPWMVNTELINWADSWKVFNNIKNPNDLQIQHEYSVTALSSYKSNYKPISSSISLITNLTKVIEKLIKIRLAQNS